MPKLFAESASSESSGEMILDDYDDTESTPEPMPAVPIDTEIPSLPKKPAPVKLAPRPEKGVMKVDIDQVHKDIVTALFSALEYIKATDTTANDNLKYYKSVITHVDELVNQTGFDSYKLNEAGARAVMDFMGTQSRGKDIQLLKDKAQAMLDLVNSIEVNADQQIRDPAAFYVANALAAGRCGGGGRRASSVTVGNSGDENGHGHGHGFGRFSTPGGTRRATRGEAINKRKLEDEQLWKASFECHKAAKLLKENQGKYAD